MRHRRWLFGIALAVTLGQPLAAQSRDRFSLDASIGPADGWGGRRPYVNPGLSSIEVSGAIRPAGSESRMFALTVGATGPFTSSLLCAVAAGTPNGCAPEYPALAHLGLLGGFERGTSEGSLRLLAGPAFYGGDGSSGLGGQVQLDAAAGGSHFALVFSARGSLIGRFTGERLYVGSLGIGLRIR